MRIQTSVKSAINFSINEIWDIGQKYVAKPTNRTLHAKGEFKAKVIRNVGLDVVPDTAPHPRHANIVNWPSGKSEQQMLAL